MTDEIFQPISTVELLEKFPDRTGEIMANDVLYGNYVTIECTEGPECQGECIARYLKADAPIDEIVRHTLAADIEDERKDSQ